MTCKPVLALLTGVQVTKGPQVVPVSSIDTLVNFPNRIGDAIEFSVPLLDGTRQTKGKIDGPLRINFWE